MVAGRPRYIHSGDLWPIVLASAAYPVVFSPVYLDDEVYMDGGITDNFPLQALEGVCDVVLGVNVSPHRCVVVEDLQSVRGIVERVMDLGFRKEARYEEDKADIVIRPEFLSQYGAFDTEAMLEIYQRGLEAGYEAIPTILSKLAETPEDDASSPSDI